MNVLSLLTVLLPFLEQLLAASQNGVHVQPHDISHALNLVTQAHAIEKDKVLASLAIMAPPSEEESVH
jgi:hypothetical protein